MSDWTTDTLKEMLDERYAAQQATLRNARVELNAQLSVLSERLAEQRSQLDKIDGAARQTARLQTIAVTVVGFLSLIVAVYAAVKP
jgi:hypothetical protein